MFAAAANRAAAVTALLEAGADPDIATAVVDVLPVWRWTVKPTAGSAT